ncbi:MAG: hypothetical protein GEU90_05795 [Gemmatimonas sp.]|nr:hypothetical protein [Gemmatimonas sp.]
MNNERRINVRRMVMLRQPPDRVWTALRDYLPAVAQHVEGIEEIRLLERSRANGLIKTVHEWRAAPSVAHALRGRIDGDQLTWLERAEWHDGALESRWSVESRMLGGGLVGSGITRVHGAMGGRGCRLQLEIATSIAPGTLGPLGEGRWKTGLEDAAATLLAKTLQDLGAAVDRFLASGDTRNSARRG